MTRLAVVALAAVLVAGCGGSQKKAAQPPPDPGRVLVDQLVAAARNHDAGAIWTRVTKATHGRLTKAQTAALVERELAPVLGGGYRTLVSQLVTDRYGVVALETPTAIVALPLRKEDGGLRADLGAPLGIAISGPLPGAHSRDLAPQVGVELKGYGAGDATAALYLDGDTLLPKMYGGSSSATVYSDIGAPFTPGRHTVIAFAATKSEAAARAWDFTVR